MIVGYGDTPTEWQADHDRNVRAFLDRCRERNLKLNKNKARLKQHEVPFIGHILTPQGLKPDPCKVKAIVDMPDPTDAQSVCRFLGMVNYLAKFLPRLSEQKYRESSQRRMLSGVGFLPMLKLWPVLKRCLDYICPCSSLL